MQGTDVSGHVVGVAGFIEARFVETDGKRLQGFGPGELRGQGRDRGGVDAATQQHPQRDIRHQASFHRQGEEFPQLLPPLLDRVGGESVEGVQDELPVTMLRGGRLVQVVQQVATGGELVDVVKDGGRGRNVTIGEIFVQTGWGNGGPDVGMSQQGRELGGEGEQMSVRMIIQRFFSESVPGEKQFSPSGVVQGEGPHAIELFRQGGLPLLVTMEQDLGVGVVGLKAVARPGECGAQLRMVVDLPVEDHPYGAVGGPHGLGPPRQVDDGESAMPQINPFFLVPPCSLGIGSPVQQGLHHGDQVFLVSGSDKTRYAAHFC
ncbi:hypothetical protein ASN18_2802 [Candidatus Magnetominusculus xianensis]|uniref:Uncharacterized protein n=1 Tax=Candidatus Magnetominusculus xianensis TaxID=1748249 RepID=A0ABR5SFX5_9BACT|nr:hypothetical protein ASN18_2802 [Candidatus Magnetominusculus xianensis]